MVCPYPDVVHVFPPPFPFPLFLFVIWEIFESKFQRVVIQEIGDCKKKTEEHFGIQLLHGPHGNRVEPVTYLKKRDVSSLVQRRGKEGSWGAFSVLGSSLFLLTLFSVISLGLSANYSSSFHIPLSFVSVSRIGWVVQIWWMAGWRKSELAEGHW